MTEKLLKQTNSTGFVSEKWASGFPSSWRGFLQLSVFSLIRLPGILFSALQRQGRISQVLLRYPDTHMSRPGPGLSLPHQVRQVTRGWPPALAAQGSGQCTPDAVACLLLVSLNFWSPWKCHRRSLSTSMARTENTFLWHSVPCRRVTALEKLSHLWSRWPTSLAMFGVQAKAWCVLWFPHFHVHSELLGQLVGPDGSETKHNGSEAACHSLLEPN